jgi:hypothetical protein
MRSFVILLLLVGCTKPNPNRCCTGEADCMAVGLAVGSTCDEGLVCRGNQCIAQACSSSSECDAAAPYCVDERCGEACTEDTQCPGFGQSGAAYCVNGGCVACRTSADCSDPMLAVCEGGFCRGCASHAECASNVCDLDTNTCRQEDLIAYAAPAGSSTSACTKTDPCTLSRAIGVLDSTRNVLKLDTGTYGDRAQVNTQELVTVYGPAKVQRFGIYGSGTIVVRDLEADAFDCGSNALAPLATLDVKRATLTLASDLDSVNNASYCNVKLSNVVIKNPFKVPTMDIRYNSTLTMDQTWIDGGSVMMRLSQGSSANITNSILSNGSATVGQPNAIYFDSSTGPSSVSFTSFYNTPWTCPTTGNVVWTSRSNIFLNERAGAPADTVDGKQCSHHYALIKPQSATPTGSNNILNQDPRFKNAANGDFHLVSGSPAIDAADPTATESSDYEGTARPQGTARDIGAFEYKP